MAKTVTVKKGDTLSQILKDAGVASYGSSSTWDIVAQASNLSSPNLIHPGNKIVIPDSVLGGGGTPAPALTSAPATAPATTPAPAPATSQELTNYLNEQQQKLQELQDYDPFGGDVEGAIDEKMEAITGGVEAPEAPDYTEMFQRLREEYNLDSLEQGINEYKNLIRQEENLLMQQRNDIREGQVRMGVIEGRVDKATRDRMEMINWYKSNAQFLSDMANSAYSYIQMVMNLEQLDYQTAKERYDTNFNQRLSIYNAIVQEAREERNWQYQLMMDQQKLASTNLTMYMDLISKGQISWNSLSTAEQTQIHKMEVQAGLPIGFMSTIKMAPGANILSTTTRTDPSGNTYADILVQKPDGSIEVQHKLLGKTKVSSGGGGGGSPTYSQQQEASKRTVLSEIAQGMEAEKGKDNKVSPTTYNANKAYWMSKGYSAKEFDDQFKGYVNKTHYQNIDTGVWKGLQYDIPSNYIY